MAPVETLKYPNITIQLNPCPVDTEVQFPRPILAFAGGTSNGFLGILCNEKVPQEGTIILGTVSD